MENLSFEEIKQRYANAREAERRKIIDYLALQKSFKKAGGESYAKNNYSGGMGRSNYGGSTKGAGRLDPTYDLTNFKYIITSYKEKNIFISLQSFDIDPNSKNLHILMDRIGIYVYDGAFVAKPKAKIVYAGCKCGGDAVPVADMFLKMETTSLELPLSDKDLEELVKIIKQKVEQKGE